MRALGIAKIIKVRTWDIDSKDIFQFKAMLKTLSNTRNFFLVLYLPLFVLTANASVFFQLSGENSSSTF